MVAWYTRNIHPLVHFASTVVWAVFSLGAVPLWMFNNADKYTGSGLESPQAFLIIGIFIWLAWAYLEGPKIRKAGLALKKPS